MTTATEMEKVNTNNNSNNTAQVKEEGEFVDPNIFAQRVEKKAYELYKKRRCQNGHDYDDWYEALKIVEAEMIAGK